jgi:hypothetical protein
MLTSCIRCPYTSEDQAREGHSQGAMKEDHAESMWQCC